MDPFQVAEVERLNPNSMFSVWVECAGDEITFFDGSEKPRGRSLRERAKRWQWLKATCVSLPRNLARSGVTIFSDPPGCEW